MSGPTCQNQQKCEELTIPPTTIANHNPDETRIKTTITTTTDELESTTLWQFSRRRRHRQAK
ncbi:hypothetical protein OS493_022843 [Desmophyllum pertusum]|uniref:Uncharacterized protein n=1 Tax=Desmophyllum pertusum TaxID=174260 RepID=A0A9W9ZMP7_9CNID|nr:hypothetical protein OS493_022843 [Desmophyllum pertusum]